MPCHRHGRLPRRSRLCELANRTDRLPGGIPDDFDRANLDRVNLGYRKPPFVPAGPKFNWKVCWNGDVFVTDNGKIRVCGSRSNSMVIGSGGLLDYRWRQLFGGFRSVPTGLSGIADRSSTGIQHGQRRGYKRRLKKPTRIVPVRDGAVIAMRVKDGENHDRYRIFISLPQKCSPERPGNPCVVHENPGQPGREIQRSLSSIAHLWFRGNGCPATGFSEPPASIQSASRSVQIDRREYFGQPVPSTGTVAGTMSSPRESTQAIAA